MEKIAKAAGVAVGTVYSHFRTREDLVAHLIADRVTRLADLGQRLLEHRDPVAALSEWLAVFGADAATYQGLPESVIRTLDDPGSPLFNSCELMRATCGALLAGAQAADQVRTDITAADVLTMTAALSSAAGASGHDASHFVAVLTDGLRQRP
ncbi:TetR/AcrR family transcriptional regulator [Mycobacterium sp. pUA109]|uniref:TetR/AcrR family transcriptional regulator n=1 Tax=Mycobacterium sp. pUA109 TaxID=3238982 RepID=UPI00351B15B6